MMLYFPSRSQYTWDRTYGRTKYNIKGIYKIKQLIQIIKKNES